MNRIITDIFNQVATINGISYTASDCIDRLSEEFRLRYPANNFYISLADFLAEWFNEEETLCVHTSGSTGKPKELRIEKRRMMNSAIMTIDFLGLKQGDTAMLCMPLQYIAGKMVVIRSLVAGLNLMPVPPCGNPMKNISRIPEFSAMIPMQVFNSLQNPDEADKLRQIKHLIIGGGSIDTTLAIALKDFPNAVWSTYGMTETLSHIALRRLNGKEKSDWYTPFAQVEVNLSQNQTLVINAPQLNPEILVTNDIVEFNSRGQFRILGRKDNTINTGGIKVQIEQVEEALKSHLSQPFMITSAPDKKFGERIVLLITEETSSLSAAINKLPVYWRPKQTIIVKELPLTENGKPDRATAKYIAAKKES